MSKAYRKTFNTRLIKKGMSYSLKDIATLFDVHIRTVQLWINEGLSKIDNKKPYLVYSEDLKVFLNERQKTRKSKCKPSQIYCCKCRKPRNSHNNEVEIKIVNAKTITVIGICPVCASVLNKINTVKNISKVEKIFKVLSIQNKHIIGCESSSVSTDKKE